MAILKIIEVMANSPTGWDDAAQNAVKHASKSVKHIRSVYVQDQSAIVDGDSIKEYRVNVKITFEVK